jgi:hypothetical protein
MCQAECQKEKIRQLCGCSALTFPIFTKDETKCTFSMYGKCLHYSDDDFDEEETCRLNCLDSCQQLQYFVTEPMIVETGNQVPFRSAEFHIKIENFEYFVIEEYFQWTFISFLGAIGGVLAFWFGLDFEVILHFLLQPISFFATKLIKKLSPETDTENSCALQIAAENFVKKLINFFNIQGLHRYNCAFMIKWLIGKIFWAAIYIAGGVYTMVLCFQQYDQFLSNGTYTNFTLHVGNSFRFPVPGTLCIPLGTFPIEKLANPQSKLSPVNEKTLGEYFKQKNLSKESFLRHDEDSVWPLALVNIAYQYLRIVYYAEAYSDSTYFNLSSYWQEILIKTEIYETSSYCKFCIFLFLFFDFYFVFCARGWRLLKWEQSLNCQVGHLSGFFLVA